MVLWGGLRPIASRVFLDSLALGVWVYGARQQQQQQQQPHDNDNHQQAAVRSYLWILVSCIFTISTAGNLTNRWPLTLPMVPFLVLQGIRRVIPAPPPAPRDDAKNKKKRKWLHYVHMLLTTLSFVCILTAAALCILFPAVELPPTEGPYNVGKVDLFLPMPAAATSTYVWVRLLYPTIESPMPLPYLTPATATEYCYHSMNFGAPAPLNQFDWILHTWRLTERMERDGASLLDTAEPLPVIVYSHGLGGHADIYSYQTHRLAAQGNVVVTITHADGSSPALTQPDGSTREFDYEPHKYGRIHGWTGVFLEMRRNQTEVRVQELVAATQAIQRWNQQDIHADLPGATNLSLKGRLDVKHLTWMGHSFGGATVLSAAYRHPDMVQTVIAHDPAIDWANTSAMSSLFAHSRITNLTKASIYKAEILGEPRKDDSIHRSANTLLLFSEDWVRKEWALTPLIQEMQEHKLLGSNETLFTYDFVPGMYHNEFSDTNMLTPTWLGRAVGMTGARNPIHTAKEAAEKTTSFLQQIRQKL